MEAIKSSQKQNQPRDTYRIAYIIHFFLGAGNLLPWNAFITAIDYFSYLYPAKHVEKVFSIAYMGSSVLVLLPMTSWSSWNRLLTFKSRMNIGLTMFILSMMVAPMIDWTWCSYSTETRPPGTYLVTVASVVLCGLADGLIGGSLVGSAGALPKEYMQAIFAGTASSGVLVSILRIITKASVPKNPRGLQISTHLYFIVSTAMLLGCMVCSNLLFRLPVIQQNYKPKDDPPRSSSRPNFFTTARKISWPAFGIFLTYVITLSIFPGYIADELKSKVLKDWYPILLITAYNVSDLAGKSSAAFYVPSNIRRATWACLARLSFYPLFIACLHGPKWLKTEIPIIFLTFLFGISNGYVTTIIMILAPKSVPAEEAEIAAVVMAVFLGLGLLGGSVFGWLWIV